MNPNRDHLVAARTLLAQARRLINDASRAQLDAHRHVPGLAAGDAQRERMAAASSLVLELVRELDAMLPDERAAVAPAPSPLGTLYCRARHADGYVCQLARDHAGDHTAQVSGATPRERKHLAWHDSAPADVAGAGGDSRVRS